MNTIQLDKRALKYVANELQYQNKMSGYLSSHLDLRKGNLTTFLPFKISDSQLYDFTTGGVLSTISKSTPILRDTAYLCEKKTNLASHLATIIHKQLSSYTDLYCIFDDVMMDPGDQDLTRFPKTHKVVENEVYHLIDQSNASLELLLDTINAVSVSWHFLCVIVETPVKNFFANKCNLSDKEFLSLFHNIKFVVVGAYDGEGFIIWEQK